MAACGSSVVKNVDEEKVLRSLIAAFGSSFSLEQIASVYCKAQKDVDTAGFKLGDMQEFLLTNTSNDTERNVENIKCAEVPRGSCTNKFFQANRNARSPNLKWRPVLAGSVSGVIGKEYSNPKPYENASNTAGKPIKVNSKVLPVSGHDLENAVLNDNKQARFSLEQIAAVYCKGQKDVDMADIILGDMQELLSTNTSNGTERNMENNKCAEVPSGYCTNNFFQANRNARSPNLKWRPVLAGSVSGVIGKEYSNPKPYENASNTAGKPIKVNSKVLPVSGHDLENAVLNDNKQARFSLEQIAAVYCKGQKDVDMAGIRLGDMQEFLSTNTSNGTERNMENNKCAEVPSGYCTNNFFQANRNARSPNLKWRPVLAGSVSGVIGKEHSNPKPYENASNTVGKPIKVNSKVLPVSGHDLENAVLNDNKHARFHQDMEDFLFSMLGDGFQLDRDVIRDVLGKCGYDMHKSMEKLFDVSAAGMKKGDNYSRTSAKLHDSYSRYERSPRESTSYKEYSGRVAYANGLDKRGGETLPEKELECPSPTKFAEKVVSESRENCHQNAPTCVADTQDKKDGDDEDDSYQVLRRAVQEYRRTMKEYYSAAIDAFGKGDSSRANNLLDQGNFFYKKARDADEESYKKIFDVRNEEHDNMLLDVHEHDAKAAIRLLKCHVINLAGTPTFNHLKVIIEMNGEVTLKGARKQWVMKFLEKYSIKWVEDTTPGAILIPLADIDPSVFVNK